MAIELIRRPLGHKISITPVSATIVDNGAGDAVVYVPGGHSLSDGDYVYIESNFDSYNGYKYVDATAYDYFKIKNSENGDYIQYVQDSEATIYISLVNHGWQGVHTPIAYELHSDISPVNEAEEEYNPNVVDSFQAYGGNTQLNLDHVLSDPVALTWIELVGTGELAGRYQILTVLQPWSVVINLAYDATYDFSGYTIVKFYNNYHINVGVYAGLESGHRWEAKKPFELSGTLKLIPDASGNVKFSIHEILRGYIEIRNNLTLDTLPNNLDFHVGFYIRYYESYDLSDGETIHTQESGKTTDDFEGHAVNAMLPFKSLNSGHLSEYINAVGYLARWLTLLDRPIAVVDRFFDISFLNQYDNADIIILRNGELFQTITNPGSGVIRVMFVPDQGFTEYCLEASTSGSAEVPEVPGVTSAITLPALSSGVNIPGAYTDWTTGSNPAVTLSGAGGKRSDIWANTYSFIDGYTYDLTADLDYSFGAVTLARIFFVILDTFDNIVYSQEFDFLGSTSGTLGAIPPFVAGSNYKKYGFYMSCTSAGSTTNTFDIDSISGTQTTPATPAIPAVPAQVITEQICIDIIEECGTTFINDDLRITDGSQLRRV